MKTIQMEDSSSGLGWATVLVAAWSNVYQWVSENGNGLIAGLMGLIGLGILFYKFRMTRMDYRERKWKIKQMLKDEDDKKSA